MNVLKRFVYKKCLEFCKRVEFRSHPKIIVGEAMADFKENELVCLRDGKFYKCE